MKKIFGIIYLFIFSCFFINNISFSANVIYDFGDDFDVKENYDLYSNIQDLELDMDVLVGPGYEEVKQKTGSDDIYVNLKYIDEHYEDVLKEEEAKVIYTDSSKLTVGIGGDGGNDTNRSLMSGRNKKIDTLIRIKNKITQDKIDKEEVEEEKKGEKKVSIYIQSLSDNPDNPEPGVAYKKTYNFNTDCETLIELMNEEGITSDSGFIMTLDGITAYAEIESEMRDGGAHGRWKGKSWALYVNGKKSSVGADLVELDDGMRIRWIETIETTIW